MVRFYSIPAAREDIDKRNIMLEIEDSADRMKWRTYHEGGREISSGTTILDKKQHSITSLLGSRILFDSRDRSILYAESIEDAIRAFVSYPYYTNHLFSEIDRVYKVAVPLIPELAEVRNMDKGTLDDDFARWVREIPPLSPEWKKLLGDKPK
ncbi:MAG: hypothetical protein HY361_04370 [Candidatus Aenigmarchaeota archaeon]|nr:hypothetical protein [Candidatus Aenigmarchaeota archaeon]